MTVVAIVVIAVSAGLALYGPQARRADLINQLKYTKGAITKARASAIEFTAPVQVSISDISELLILRDSNRNGDFTDNPTVVVGQSATVGSPSPYTKVIPYDVTTAEVPDLPHWSKLTSMGNVGEFNNNTLIIMPDGHVVSGSPATETSGTFFFKTRASDFYGALHVTAMGEVKIAYRRAQTSTGDDFNGWIWQE
jgi:hypothetical protein